MARVVSLFLPMWATDRYRRKLGERAPAADQPVIMVSRSGSRRVVTSVDAAAIQAGLRVGMPAAKAQALVSGLIMENSEPAGDEDALERLALWALRIYAPVVASDTPDGLVIDTTGADHLHGNEELMITGMVNRLHHAGVHARVAIADTWGAAHALARYSGQNHIVVPPGETSRHTLHLPIHALRLPLQTIDALRVMGFETIGELAATPRAPLTLRFGPEVGRRIDQLLGRLAEPIEPIRAPELIEVKRAFPEPIGAAETISRYIRKLVDQLIAALEVQGLGVRRVDLICQRVDNTIQAVRVGTQQSNRDAKRLTRLLTDKVETIEPGFGIEMMSLTATFTEEFETRQMPSSLIEETAPDVTGLIDLLANRIGAGRIYKVIPVASDVPERSIKCVAPTSEEVGTPIPSDWPRPTRLFAHPEPIDTIALMPDHPPVSFTWRGVRRKVKRADGPERVFGEWWRRDKELAAVRDYFQVEDEEGARYWIYRAGDGEHGETGSHKWFMHGLFT